MFLLTTTKHIEMTERERKKSRFLSTGSEHLEHMKLDSTLVKPLWTEARSPEKTIEFFFLSKYWKNPWASVAFACFLSMTDVISGW